MTSINDFAVNFYNIQLAFFGISITVFTVLFAFILNKRDEIKLMNFQIEKGDNSPSLKQRRTFVLTNLKNLKSVNFYTLKIVISTFTFFVFSFIISNLNFNKILNEYLLLLLYGIIFMEIILFALLIYKIIRYYSKSTKI
ncbi:hypothetical protein [Flavobacterium sp. N1719]|uniref:hypothetical protein n=1 Tax=Flavobacterium sp. N1719 TaxID=2885633 RepID=UPI0022236219|nr:hypothetical protein [Flavobacterium sp. N1719]